MDKIGKYEIVEQLGQGGMGVIYLARDPDIHREVAIKTIRNELFAEADQREKVLKQFMVEARAAGRLSHPHIATIYEVGRQDDLTYIVMQYVPGRSLRKVLESGVRFTAEEAVALVLPLLQALDYAHRQGIVHRDIKPDNILIDAEGRAILVDFGIATIESVNVTRTRMTSATPAYMSPEQVLEGEVDHRTDIFSLGIILFELVAGRRPFSGENIPSLLNRIVNESPARFDPKSAEPPEGLEAVIDKALAKDPAGRFSSCAEMAVALEESIHALERTTPLRTPPPVAVPKSLVRSASPGRRKKLRPLIAAGALVLLAGAGFLLKGLLGPPAEYEALVAISPFDYGTDAVPRNLVEYALDRALSASTALPVIVETDKGAWERQKDAKNARGRRPRIEISGSVEPTVTGYEIKMTVANRGRRKAETFACKGHLDLISAKIDALLAFCADHSGGDIGRIAGGRTFAQISTGNWDALSHYLKGLDAWNKLASDAAHSEFKTALENDPDFALARLKLAEVKLFRGDRLEARADCRSALAKPDRLIEYDILRIKALLARLEAKPAEERAHLMRLIEAFPLKKEYLYDFAESYFHAGDGAEAIPYYQRALDLDPSYALAHNHLAFCLSWTGDHAKAAEHFLTYVKLDQTANAYDSLASGYMFAGLYDKALEALGKGKDLDARLDYLYANFATNSALLGALGQAEAHLKTQLEVSTRDVTRQDAAFDRAWLAWQRGDAAAAEASLRPVRDYYSGPAFDDRLDESPVLPIWLTGVIAARQKNAPRLREMAARLEAKVKGHGVNATNYFPVLKFALHLRALEAGLRKDPAAVLQAVEEAERIKAKMGYWSSPYNLAFFLDAYAGLLLDLGASTAKAGSLLDEALAYNPSCAPALVDRVRLLTAEDKKDEARQAAEAAAKSLARADAEWVLLKDLAAFRARLGAK